ncbi:hypothetical protein GE061_011865 [Apolygus lucorum]|uniref:Uncharacterized protein n=1 Tax=Apolygus lucorum TaxID=248454 RepID=A0A8S9XQY7_APOLU|nr:hypothetical protein GE061_011865 [Apolygus lucorum]
MRFLLRKLRYLTRKRKDKGRKEAGRGVGVTRRKRRNRGSAFQTRSTVCLGVCGRRQESFYHTTRRSGANHVCIEYFAVCSPNIIITVFSSGKSPIDDLVQLSVERLLNIVPF